MKSHWDFFNTNAWLPSTHHNLSDMGCDMGNSILKSSEVISNMQQSYQFQWIHVLQPK